MNILVTGGAGYIGSHTCKELKKNNFNPIVFDNLSNGHKDFVRWGSLIEGEINDAEALSKAILSHQIEAVIHFAGQINVGESVSNPEKYFEQNFNGTLSLLNAMKENKIFKIVFSSTAAVYGNIDIDVIDESTTTNPINPYGLSKYFSEKAIETYYQSAGFSGICLRYFNASGASSELEIGEDHNPEFHLIPKLISSVRGSKEKLKVFGRDYPTKDGTCIRDYIHVEDLARAHVLSLKKLFNSEKTIYENINLGSGSGFSILEIIKNFEKLTGEKVSWEYSEKRTGDPAKLVADISKAKKTLNWTPEKSNLENILTTAFNWHKKRFKD